MLCEVVWQKTVGKYLRKFQRWNPLLITLQGNVSKMGLRHLPETCQKMVHRKCYFLEKLYTKLYIYIYILQISSSRIWLRCLTNLRDWMPNSFHSWSAAGGAFSDNITNSIHTLPHWWKAVSSRVCHTGFQF